MTDVATPVVSSGDAVPVVPTTTTEATAPVTPVIPVPVAAPVPAPSAEAPVVPAPTETTPAPTQEAPAAEAPKPDVLLSLPPEAVGETPPPEVVTEIPPPVFEAFTVPEGVTLGEDQVKALTEKLGKLETLGKIDRALMQQTGQEMVDLHLEGLEAARTNLTAEYEKAWQKQAADWKQEFLADPEIGGNRHETTFEAAKEFIRTHGGTLEQQNELLHVLGTTGVGNHRAILRIFSRAQAAMPEGKPLGGQKPMQQHLTRQQLLYETP